MTTVTSITELYDAVGYLDDSESERVSGDSEGVTIYCDGTGTWDRGATDNVLWPASARQEIIVPEGLTIQGLLYARGAGSGGHAGAFRLTGGGTWDCKGYGDISTDARPSGAGGSSIMIDGRPAVIDIAAITNSTGSSTVNLVTFVQRPGEDPCVQMIGRSTVTAAGADNISFKGISGSGPDDALVIVYDVDSSTPGTGASDQALTNHDDADMLVFGGSFAGDTTQKQAIVNATNGGRLEVVNADITGKLQEVTYFAGIDLDLDGLNYGLVIRDMAGVVGKQSRIRNPNTGGTSNNGHFAWTGTSASHTATFTEIVWEGGDPTKTTVIGDNSQTNRAGTLTLVRNYFDDQSYRALDLRGSGNDVQVVLTDTVCDTANLSYLPQEEADITGSGCVSSASSFPSGVNGNVGVERAVTQGDIDGTGAGQTLQPEPDYVTLAGLIMDSRGDVLLASNTAEEMAASLSSSLRSVMLMVMHNRRKINC
jgi:hypothetical protein